MSSIDRILIRGVRSFSPDNMNTIVFEKPLNLIVGTNGAGKTTIIEALKYATTGESPPPHASSIAHFLHDPKVAGEKEVKAQIKLKLIDVAGRPVVITRTMSVKQARTKSKLSAKTLDSVVLMKDEDGRRLSLSKKCAEIDKLVPRLLGVSPAVLTNVIFCHQEDANWPLAPPAQLKNKFEEIFAASRYRKALKEIKDQVKDHKHRLDVFRSELQTHATIQEQAARVRAQMEETRDKISQTEADMEKMEGKLATIAQRKQELEVLAADLEALEQRRATITTRIDLLRDSQAQLVQQMKEQYVETDAELMEMEKQFADTMRAKQDELQQLRAMRDRLSQEIEDARSRYNAACTAHGRVEAESQQHEHRVRTRLQRIQALVRTHQLSGEAAASPDRFTEELTGLMADKEAALAAVKTRNDEAEQRVGADLEAARVERARLEETVASHKRTLANSERQVEEIRGRAAAMAGRAGASTADLERDVASQEADLVSFRASFDLAQADRDVAAKVQRADGLEEDLRTREVRLSTLNSQLAESARIRVAQEQLAARKQEQTAVIESGRDAVQAVLGTSAATVTDDVQAMSAAIAAQAKAAKDDVFARTEAANQAKHSVVASEGRLADLAARLEDARSEAASKRKSVLKKTKGNDVDTLIQQTTERLEEFRARLARDAVSSHAGQELYAEFLRIAESQHHCPLCRRGFADAQGHEDRAAFQSFFDLLQDQALKLQTGNAGTLTPEERKTLEDNIAGCETILTRLRSSVKPMADRVAFLESETIPELEQRLGETQGETARLQDTVDAAQAALDEAKVRAEAIAEAEEAVARMQRVADEVAALRASVETEEQALRARTGGAVVGGDVEQQIATLEAEMTRMRAERTATNSEVRALRTQANQFREQLVGRERRLGDMRERLLQQQSADSERRALEEQAARIEAGLRDTRRAHEEAERAVAPVTARIAELERMRDQQRQANARAYADAKREVDVYLQDVQWLRQANADIARYEQTHGGATGALDESARKVASLKRALEEVEARSAATARDIEDTAQLVAQTETTQRTIRDNLAHRKGEREIQTLTEEAKELQKQAAALEEANRGRRGETIAERLAQIDNRHRDYEKALAELRGVIEVHQQHYEVFEDQLQEPQYRDGEENYRLKLIELKTTETASRDLERYQKALDSALQRYHTIKMREINNIIKELWQKTYKGADIDTLAIRADVSGKSNYDYRVVMIKDGVELPMRGRCSAGQKVLASLIIRMALAECFCLNCGVLALDEPSTNLDRANKKSFARSLATIIDDRSRQANFQLICITHDEEFVEMLGHRVRCDYLWRVTKDHNGHSKIQREEFGEALRQ